MLMKIALVVLVFCLGFGSAHPSAAEFNLFCRILAEANNMMYGPGYVYDENADRETIKEMTVLFNATTDNMNEFRQTLWVTKDFFEAHPPPTQSESRKRAHREIGNLIKKGEEKIRENKKIALEVNKEINEAKLSVAHGIFGDHVNEVPKNDKNITKILNNTKSIFNNDSNVKESCGNGGANETGKTLINDLFCLCAGGDANDAEGPCHPKIWPPKSWGGTNNNGCCKSNKNDDKDCKCKWTQIKFGPHEPSIQSFNESFQKIEQVCREEMMANEVNSKDMTALLGEYVGMIGMGDKKTDKTKKKIFGHSERSAGGDNNHVTECTGEQGSWKDGGKEKGNDKICVDYSHNLNKDGKTYNITWHEKFKNYTKIMQDAKKIEEGILKNRAALLLLKSQAWIAYSREKDDETSNLDDMNASGEDKYHAENKQNQPKNQETECIHVSSQSTQGTRPSQDASLRPEAPHYHLVSSTETTQREAQTPAAGGGEITYIYISSTESSQATKKPGEDGGGEPEIAVISSESATPAPPETPTPTQQDPPTQSAKRLREDNKTGE